LRLFRVALWAGICVNGAVMVWLWLHDGGITQVHHPADLWTSAGRITGLLGAYVALVQVLLLARLPPLEARIGFDRLTVWHRRNGKLCLYLVVAHVVLITVGYAGSDQISVPKEFSNLLSSYPGMVAATVGTAMMIAIVASSYVIVRRRLPYEAWYALHFTIYAALALAYVHQIPTGNDFTSSSAASDWWIALYVVTLVLLLAYRVVRPALMARRHRLRVSSVRRESPDTVSIAIAGRDLDALPARAGQFMLWRFLSRGRWWQSHPFSFSAVPDGRSLRITVKASGGFTRALADVAPGTRVLAEGPFGRFVSSRRGHDRVTLIAGGIGITPIRALLEELHGGPITVIHRVLSDGDCVLREELSRLAAERGAELHVVIGDHREPANFGLLSREHLLSLVPAIAEGDVFLCGPREMMDLTHRSLRAAGVPSSQIHSERFTLAM
jgi:predicted ferric reductase